MNRYHGYAHPYYYSSPGAWPWDYVGQAPPEAQAAQAAVHEALAAQAGVRALPALDPNFPVTSAFNRVFFGAYGRMPTPMEMLDYAFGWVIDGYGDAFAFAAQSAGSWPTDRTAQLRLMTKQISSHVRQMLSRSGL